MNNDSAIAHGHLGFVRTCFAAIALFALTGIATAGEIARGLVVSQTEAANGIHLLSIRDDGYLTVIRRICQTGDAFGSVTVTKPICATAHNDIIYVCDTLSTTSQILKFDQRGRFLGVFKDSVPFAPADSCIVSPDGVWLYFSAAFTTGKNTVYRYKIADGTGGAYITGVSTARGLAFDGDGKLYVACRGNNAVRVFDVSGATAVEESVSYDLNQASGVAVNDTDGRVYVTDKSSGAVWIFTKGDGSTSTKVTTKATTVFSMFFLNGRLFSSSYGKSRLCSYDKDVADEILVDEGISSPGCLTCFTPSQASLDAAWYRFDEVANSGTITNAFSSLFPIAPTYAQTTGTGGIEGGALRLADGNRPGKVGGRARLCDSGALLPQKGDFSLFFWMAHPTTADASTQYLMANRQYGSDSGRTMISIYNHRIQLFHASAVSFSLTKADGTVVDDNKWHHVGITRAGATFSIWVDGVLEATTESLNASIGQTYDWCIGSGPDERSSALNAGMCIDDLRVYERTLSASEIGSLYTLYAQDPGSLTPPEAPTATYDPTFVDGLGTVVNHLFAYQTYVDGVSLARGASQRYCAFGTGICRYASDSESYFYGRNLTATDWTWAGRSNFYIQRPSLWIDANDTACIAGPVSSFNSAAIDTRRVYRAYAYAGNFAFTPLLDYTNKVDSAANDVQSVSFARDGKTGNVYLPYVTAEGRAGFATFRFGTSTNVAFASAAAASEVGLGAVLVTNGQTHAYFSSSEGAVRLDAASDPTATPTWGGTETLPGSDRPFALVCDEVRGKLWAVTAPNGTSLKLFVREEGVWSERKTVLTVPNAETYAILQPTAVVDGKDLLVAYALAAPDGSVGARSLAEPNYVMSVSVPNFRALAPRGSLLFFR